MLRRRVSLLVLSLWTGGAYGQSPESSSGVDRWVQEALEHNGEILAARQRVMEVRGLLRQAGVRPAATVEVNAASGRPLGTSGEEEFAAGYSQPIETGGKRSKRILVAEKALELAEAELAERGRQLAYEVKIRYIEVVTAQRKLEAIDRIAGVNQEAYRLMDERVRRDDAAPLERQLLLVEVHRAEAQRAVIHGQAEAAHAELRRTAAIGPDEPARAVWSPPAAMVATPGETRRSALELRSDLRAARALESQSGAEISLVDAEGRPDLTVAAQYARRYSRFEDPVRTTAPGSPLLLNDQDNILTLGISIPLRTRGRNQGNLEAAVARQRAARLRFEHLEATIPLEVDAAWQRYEGAGKALEILGRVLEESQRNLAVIRQAYSLGQLRLLDVLNEQRRVFETELAGIDAEAELARSRAELERAVGGDLR